MTAAGELVDAYRRMLDEGLIQGTAGNVSVRAGRGMLITPSSLDPAVMTERARLRVRPRHRLRRR